MIIYVQCVELFNLLTLIDIKVAIHPFLLLTDLLLFNAHVSGLGNFTGSLNQTNPLLG